MNVELPVAQPNQVANWRRGLCYAQMSLVLGPSSLVVNGGGGINNCPPHWMGWSSPSLVGGREGGGKDEEAEDWG